VARGTGFEAVLAPAVSRGSAVPLALVRAGSDTPPPDAAAESRGERVTRDPLPSAVPSFLEACAKLAGEAAARGDFVRARELIEKAARVAAVREATA